MINKGRDDEREDILDQGLASYVEAEPLEGLEERVLARVRVAEAEAGSSRAPGVWRAPWVWLAAGTAVAVLVVAAVMLAPRSLYAPAAESSTARVAQNAPIITSEAGGEAAAELPAPQALAEPRADRVAESRPAAASPRNVASRRPSHSLAPVGQPLPKLDRFPSASPLSAEEKALLAFVQQRPVLSAGMLADMSETPPDRLEVAPLTIEPLRWDDMPQ
jgi:hypothetical protein